MYKKRLLVFFCVALLAGCTTKDLKQAVGPSNSVVVLKQPLYALLQKTESGYRFTRYQTHNPNQKNEPWVSLATGEPLWNMSDEKRCGKGLIKDLKIKVPDCSALVSDVLFLEKNIDKVDAAVRALGAVYTFGLTLTGVSYDVKFNATKYKSAYDQALANVHAGTLSEIDNELSSAKGDYEKVRNIYNTIFSASTVDFDINDQSGLYSDQLDFKKSVRLEQNDLSKISGVLADTPDVLLAKLKRQHQIMQQEWQLQSENVKVRCSQVLQGGFEFTLQCPSIFQVNNNRASGKVVVNVMSRNFDNVMPSNFHAQDDVLFMRFDGRKIGLSNTSSKFITVDSVAFYYNGKIAQRNRLGIELAPQAALLPNSELRIQDFPIESRILRFEDITKAKAIGTNVEFGFAIKYKILDTNLEQTLYSTKKYPLYDLITQK